MGKNHPNNVSFYFGQDSAKGPKAMSYQNLDFCITDGQPKPGPVTTHMDGPRQFVINVSAGRHGADKCASVVKDYIGSQEGKIIHTGGGNILPSKLNFAFKGILNIESDAGTDSIEVWIGQGHHGSEDNWFIASNAFDAVGVGNRAAKFKSAYSSNGWVINGDDYGANHWGIFEGPNFL